MDIKNKSKIVIIAGEASGDFLGANLMKALKNLPDKTPEFYGVGSEGMEEEGLNSFFSAHELSVMGFFMGIKKFFSIWKRLRETKKKILDLKPDVIVTIDSPGFNFLLGKALKRKLKNTPLIHYVAPTVWAWKKGRAKKISNIHNHLMALFPFEPIYFKKHNLKCTFVGHPIVEMKLDEGDGEAFKKKYAISPNDSVFVMLPGSRESELRRHIPIFLDMLTVLGQTMSRMQVIIPTLPHLKPLFEELWITDVKTQFVTDLDEKKDVYAAGTIAIAASGTIALELAEAKLPMIITYKVSTMTAWLVKRLIQTRYFCMINILLRRQVVPELLQGNATGSKLALEALKILRNPQKKQQQIDAFKRVHEMLTPGDLAPSEAAAKVIADYL